MVDVTLVTPEVLQSLALPPIQGGKEERGRVMMIAGGRQVPGAIRLAGEAVLRSGAGKLQIVTVSSLCAALGLHLPEARVFGVDETLEGEIDPQAAAALLPRAKLCDTLLVGPGMVDSDGAGALARTLLEELEAAAFVLDAAALMALCDCGSLLARHGRRVVITPHHGEMAAMCGRDDSEISADPAGAALRAAERLGVTVALKGRITLVAAPDGRVLEHRHASEGLGTAGSGDVLAGVIAGLLARGAEPLAAAAWGVAAHARAGERLGPPGYLARELPGALPQAFAGLNP
jgi:ADP-dependent NAD(P)H-hydrate dehydratase